MDTLTELTDAVIILAQIALVARFVILCAQCANQEDQDAGRYKKQRKNVIIALIVVTGAYDIPRLIQFYF